MSEALYKVQFHGWIITKQGWRSIFTDWLEDHGRMDHLVNIYLNGYPLTPTIVVVLNDRTTAIMLKLSLG